MTLILHQEDMGSKDFIELSCQLIYKALNQQLKILFCDKINIQAEIKAKKAFFQILDLLTPFENDMICLHPNFYVNFIKQSPLAWSFIQKYIFERMINNEPLPNIDLSADKIIANILNERDNYNDKSILRFTEKDGLDILKKIVIGAKLSLFLNDADEGAASFAIRLMHYKLNIDPEEFKKNSPNDRQLLKELYSKLCSTTKLSDINTFDQDNHFKNQTFFIAKELINECRTTFLVKRLFGTDETQFHQSFLNIIGSLSQQKELSKKEKKIIYRLSLFIRSQILDPSIPQRAELASFALNKYPALFQDKASSNLIKKAYDESPSIENPNLYSACQKFLKYLSDIIDSDAEMKQKENFRLSSPQTPSNETIFTTAFNYVKTYSPFYIDYKI